MNELLEVIKTNNQPPSISKAAQFAALVQAGVDAWTKAGELLVELVEENPSAYADIIKEFPNISVDVLLAFERIGRKKVHPHLMIDTSPAARRLITLPYDMQVKYHKADVIVCVSIKDGKPLTKEKPIAALSHKEAAQVIGPDGIRTVDEQAVFVRKTQKPARQTSKGEPIKPRAFRSLGFYQVSMQDGAPVLTQIPTGGFHSQRVIMGKVVNNKAAVIDAIVEIVDEEE